MSYYCGTSDIDAALPTISFGTTTTITITQLTDIINKRAQWIDDSISRLYSVPVGTANYGTATLYIINLKSAMYDTLERLTAIGQSEENEQAGNMLEEAKEILDNIIDGKIILMGTTSDTTATRQTAYTKGITITGTLDSEGNEREAIFKVEDIF